jgi:hypothetical protein
MKLFFLGLLLTLTLTGCGGTFFVKEEPYLVERVENGRYRCYIYYDKGDYIAYYYDNGILTRVDRLNRK